MSYFKYLLLFVFLTINIFNLSVEAQSNWWLYPLLTWSSPCLTNTYCVQRELANGFHVNTRMDDSTIIEWYGSTPVRFPGTTPLILAADYERNEAVVQTLIRAGADVHAKTAMGWTALHSAADHQDVAVVEILINAGADPNAQAVGISDSTPLLIAVTQPGGSVRSMPVIDVLIRAGADVNAMYASVEYSMTSLHVAVRSQDFALMRTLLNVPGINVNARTTDGETPLHFAVRSQNPALVRALLNVPGINVDARSNYNETPLEAFLGCCFPSHPVSVSNEASENFLSIIRALLEAGATPPDTFSQRHQDWVTVSQWLRGNREYYFRLFPN